MTEKGQDISEFVEENRSLDIELLLKSKKRAAKELEKDPVNPDALAAFDQASKMLDDRTRADTPSEDIFISRIEVFKYLKNQGYRIGRSRFYEQCPPTGGMLQIESDATVKSSSLMRYIKRAGLKRVGGPEKAYDRKIEKKIDAEILKTEESAKRIQMENLVAEGKYVDVAEVEQEQAIKAGALAAGLDHMFTVSVWESIRIVSGNLKRSEALMEFWIDKKRELLDEFSKLRRVELEIVDDEQWGDED